MQNAFKYYKTAKNLPSVHTAQKEKKQKGYQRSPIPISPPCLRHEKPQPPLRKTLNIYIFNPIKNVKKKKKKKK